MADYRPSWDDELYDYARNWLNKHPADLTPEEITLLQAFIAAERRLKKVDEFLGSLR
jgi:hypothetical protein